MYSLRCRIASCLLIFYEFIHNIIPLYRVNSIYFILSWFQALIASSFAKLDYEKVKEVTSYVLKVVSYTKLFFCYKTIGWNNLQMNFICQIGVIVGIALALLLSASFGRLAEVFSKDPMVIQIVRSGVLVWSLCLWYFDKIYWISITHFFYSLLFFLFLKFVSASQPVNALAFIFDGLHYGVSDFSYSASSMVCA